MAIKKEEAIVVVSGGLDSAVVAQIASRKHSLAFLHISYGQKTEKRELRSFKDLAAHFKVKKRLVANIKYLKDIGGSSITDKNINISKASLNVGKISNAYVSIRNIHLLSIAYSWAEVLGVEKIYAGLRKDSGFPDTTKKFLTSLNKCFNEGSQPEQSISIESPVLDYSKEEIVKRASKHEIPLHITWSCYKNNDVACGECEGCVSRLKAFKAADIFDPLEYMVYPKL